MQQFIDGIMFCQASGSKQALIQLLANGFYCTICIMLYNMKKNTGYICKSHIKMFVFYIQINMCMCKSHIKMHLVPWTYKIGFLRNNSGY